MAERSKYEKWLQDLDAKRDSTPGHVLERVRTDYTSRLEAVLEKLGEHTGSMQEHAANLVARLRELEDTERRLRDERAEAELRREVGELSQSDFEAVSRKAEKEIAKLQENQQLIADDLNRIRELLGGGSDAGLSHESARAPRRSTDFDELAFLKSVVGTPPQSSTPPGNARVESKVEKQPAPAAPAPAPSSDAASTPVANKAVPERQPDPALVQPPAAPVVPTAPDVAEPLAAHVSGNHPIVLRTSGVVEQPKTLKCAECGAMNYPTEWYCERCGAELAAI